MILNLTIVLILLTGCGSGGGSVPVIPSESLKDGDILIHTQMYSPPAVSALANERRTLAVINSVYSTMVAIDPIRMPAISSTNELIINTTFFNNTPGRILDLDYGVDVENDIRIIREKWTCSVCYPHITDTEESCQGVWDVPGGFFYNTSTPTLPACAGDPPFGSVVCKDFFPANTDCRADAIYRVEYIEPGSGCHELYGSNLNMGPGESVTVAASIQGTIDIRRDHLARAFVQTETGRVVGDEYYIFDVGP